MNTASRMVFDGKLDPLAFRDATSSNLVERLRLAVAFCREDDTLDAGGLVDTLSDLRAAHPELSELVSEILTELAAAPRVGRSFHGPLVRDVCSRLLAALGDPVASERSLAAVS